MGSEDFNIDPAPARLLLSLSLWVIYFICVMGGGGKFQRECPKIPVDLPWLILRSWVSEYVRDVHLWLWFLLFLQRSARQVQGCEVPGGQRGRCVNMEDCVLRDIHLDYVKNKGYFCLLRNQRLVLTLLVLISVLNFQFQLHRIRVFVGW